MAGSRAMSAREPGQVRKEAALSGHREAMRGRPTGATSSERVRGTCFEGGCTAPFFPPRATPGRTGPGTRLERRAARLRLALPPPPPALVRRRRGAGARGPHALQRDRAGEGPPRLSVRRLARHWQDLDGEDPRRLAELRAGPDRLPLRGLRVVRDDRV